LTTVSSNCIDLRFLSFHSVAYLEFPSPGDKVSLGVATQAVHEQHNELEVKGRRKLNRAPRIVVSRPGVGNLFTITGRMNCALSLAGHKIN